MPYGTIKVDNVIYTKGGVDTTITVSGIVDSLSGAISVTGSISGASVSAPTGTFTTLSGNTTAGTTATFVTGVFTTSLSGATITGNTGQFSNITGVSGVFTTRISGATITGNTGQFSSITGISGVFTSVSGTTFTVTSGVFASGTAAAPSVSVGTTTNGLYSSATNEVALATNSTSRLVVDASGNVNIDSGTFYVDAVNNRVGIGTTSPGSPLAVESNAGNQVKVTYPSIASYYLNVTSAGALDINKDGTSRLFVDASGNLGLGVVPSAWGASFKVLDFAGASFASTTTGTATLIVQNAYYDSAWKYKSSTNATLFQTDSGSFQWYTSTNTPSTNGAITFTQAMTLDASGNLGVGATSPGAKFHVAGDSSDGTQARITGATNQNYQLRWGFDTTNLVGRIQSIHVGTAYKSLSLNPDGGNVGIGTAGPAKLLHVQAGSVSGAARGGSFTKTLFESSDAIVSYWEFQAASTAINDILFSKGSTGSYGVVGYDHATDALRFSTDSTERARIDSSGRLLVGATGNSGGALLQVNGDRIRVATAKTPASAAAAGTAGEVCWDASYIYVCTATDTWKRAAIATW